MKHVLTALHLCAFQEGIYKPSNAFVRPIKQDMIKNDALKPMTRLMLALLTGWDGAERGTIETTAGIIAKHLGRSVRQVYRLLDDARAAGYIATTKTADRIGYITGLRIRLTYSLIKPPRIEKTRPKNGGFKAMTQTADTNTKRIKIKAESPQEKAYLDKLELILQRNGLSPTLI